VQAGLAAATDKNLGVFGADVGSQCLAAGLVDEIPVFGLPVLMGAGVFLYRSDEMSRIGLEEISSTSSGSYTRLLYRVLR
jgi:hypothetical protein